MKGGLGDVSAQAAQLGDGHRPSRRLRAGLGELCRPLSALRLGGFGGVVDEKSRR